MKYREAGIGWVMFSGGDVPVATPVLSMFIIYNKSREEASTQKEESQSGKLIVYGSAHTVHT